MYWKITPYEDKDADYCFMPMPAEDEADHCKALRYAHARLEQGWDELAHMPFGTPVTVTISLCYGEIPYFDNEEWIGENDMKTIGTKPNQAVIDLLRKALTDAESGIIQGVAMTSVNKNEDAEVYTIHARSAPQQYSTMSVPKTFL
jgi:hypothetical protein